MIFRTFYRKQHCPIWNIASFLKYLGRGKKWRNTSKLFQILSQIRDFDFDLTTCGNKSAMWTCESPVALQLSVFCILLMWSWCGISRFWPWYSRPEVNKQVLCSSSGQLALASGDCICSIKKLKTKWIFHSFYFKITLCWNSLLSLDKTKHFV